MKRFRPYILALMGIFLSTGAFAQDSQLVSDLRKSAYIYVVVIVMTVVMLGLLTFVILTDRKLTKLENKLKNK